MNKLFTVFYSPGAAAFKSQIERLLMGYMEGVIWRPVTSIVETPASSTFLVVENELSNDDMPLLASRKAAVIVDLWTLDNSIEWVKKGATACFSSSSAADSASWLYSEFANFTRTRNADTDASMLQVVMDTIPVPIFYKDHQHIYRGCNEAFCEFLGLSKDEIVGSSVYDVAPKHLADIYYAADCDLLSKGGTQRYEAEVQYADGSIHEIEFNKAVFKRPDGEAGGQVGVMLDITERNHLMKQLEIASYKDQLTGASNRRDFDRVIHEEWKASKKSGKALSLMSLDLDHFKSINDLYGHSGGDEALKLIVDWLEDQLESNDSLFRVGGEEFYIVMRDTNLESALEKAESLRNGLEQHVFQINDKDVQLTLSIGVVQLDMDVIIDQILELIDKALYEAKKNGRNQVRAAK